MNFEDIKLIAHSFIRELRNAKIDLLEVYLFGSYAHGNPNMASDIDICVVSPSFGVDFIHEIVLMKQIAHKISDNIEPIPFNSERLHDKFDPLSYQIRSTGIPLLHS